jgi:hypothetical protein
VERLHQLVRQLRDEADRVDEDGAQTVGQFACRIEVLKNAEWRIGRRASLK